MRNGNLLFILIAICLAPSIYAGPWKNYTSMKTVRSCIRSGDTYFAATSGGMFIWNSRTDQFQQITNAEGLQTTDLTVVRMDEDGQVWTGTTGGLIHVLNPSTRTWRYILNIRDATEYTNKRINNITIQGDTALFCTDFGVSVFRRSRFEFGDSYTRFGSIPASLRVSARAAVLFNDSIWVTISDGQNNNRVAVAHIGGSNLVDPSSWDLRSVGGPSVVPLSLVVFQNRLYCGTNLGVFTYSDGTWNALPTLAGQEITAMAVSGDSLAVASQFSVFLIDSQDNVRPFGSQTPYQISSLVMSPSHQPVAGSSGGLLVYTNTWNAVVPNGPEGNQFLGIGVDATGVVWCGSGTSNGKGVFRFDGTQWMAFNQNNTSLPTNQYYRISMGCDGSVWASSWGEGMVEFLPRATTVDSSRIFNTNVGMVGIENNPQFVVTSTVACDSRGNVWMSILDASDKNILAVRQTNGDWVTVPVILRNRKLSVTLGHTNPADRTIAVDAFDNVWIIVRDDANRGVVSLNNRGIIDSIATYHVTIDDGLPGSEVRTIIADKRNNIWIGTDRGIAIVLDPSNPKRPGAIASYKPLHGLVINTIAIDPLDQKWVGTPDGVVLLSPDGTQQIASYTVENTGGTLIDNDVKSIAIDEQTGTVYMATLNGLASLQTSAVAPRETFGGLTVFPNPYTLPGTGDLTIDGLVENSTIKILSVDGKLIRELRSPGGRIGFWDGRDQNGNLVASGIYIIAAYSEDARVGTGKVAIIRR